MIKIFLFFPTLQGFSYYIYLSSLCSTLFTFSLFLNDRLNAYETEKCVSANSSTSVQEFSSEMENEKREFIGMFESLPLSAAHIILVFYCQIMLLFYILSSRLDLLFLRLPPIVCVEPRDS